MTQEMLLKYLYPPNLEHPNVTQRLDLFAIYGPVLNYHSVYKCFCPTCRKEIGEFHRKNQN